MKKLGKNYEEAKAYSGFTRLEPGKYVLVIKDVACIEGQNGNSDRLRFAFDIAEGESKDYYMQQFQNSTLEDKKWKGTYDLWVPVEDNSERDNNTMRKFKTVMNDFEASNEGFHWNWDEKKLKGLKIGGLFREEDWAFNGREGVSVRCYGFTSLEALSTAKLLGRKYLNGGAAPVQTSADGFVNIPTGEESELPFI